MYIMGLLAPLEKGPSHSLIYSTSIYSYSTIYSSKSLAPARYFSQLMLLKAYAISSGLEALSPRTHKDPART